MIATLLASVALTPGKLSQQPAPPPNQFLVAEVVAHLNGMVDKYKKLVSTKLGNSHLELKVRNVALEKFDAQFLYVRFGVRVREIFDPTQTVLYTKDGSCKGKFQWGPVDMARACLTPPPGTGTPLLEVTETHKIPKVSDSESSFAATLAVKANFQGEIQTPMWPTLSATDASATEWWQPATTLPVGPAPPSTMPPMPNRMKMPVTLSNASARKIRVKYATADGTAKAGVDYKAAAGELEISPNSNSGEVLIQLIPRGGKQGKRTFAFKIWSPVNGKILKSGSIGTILD